MLKIDKSPFQTTKIDQNIQLTPFIIRSPYSESLKVFGRVLIHLKTTRAPPHPPLPQKHCVNKTKQ